MPSSFRRVSGLALLAAVVLVSSRSVEAAAPPVSVLGSSVVGQEFGTIKGRLVYGGASVPENKVLVRKGDANAKDAAVCAAETVTSKGMQVDPKTKGIQFGVAYVVSPKGKNPAAEAALLKKTEVEIDQKGCEFVPHVAALHQNQTLLFKSSDPVPHNVHFTAFANGDLNQMLAPQGQLSKKFAAPERRACKLVCDIHPWMESYFMVFDHPFFAVTNPDGSFEIKGVPAGVQNVVVWHETGFVTAGARAGVPVTVQAGETVDMGEIKLTPKN